MALVEETLFGREDKVEIAIKRMKSFEPSDGYYLAFSGGKDSQCIYHLAQMAGVKFDAHYAVTSVDPPELVRFIKKYYPDVKFEFNYWGDGKPEHYFKDGKPKPKTMWNLIADQTIPPTRQARYCCANLKEPGGSGRVVITGVRWAESVRRRDSHAVVDIRTTSKKLHNEAEKNPAYRASKHKDSIGFMDDNDGSRKMVEQCYMRKKTTVNPIVDWTEEDVWEFLNEVAKVPHCELYDPPYNEHRLGCIGCPLAGRKKMLQDFERYPKYKALYIRAFDQMIKNHPGEIRVASGQPVDENAGGGYSDIHRMGRMEHLTAQPTMRPDNQVAPPNGEGAESLGDEERSRTPQHMDADASIVLPHQKKARLESGGVAVRFDMWTGQQIFDLWTWALGERKDPPPHPLVPKRYTGTKRWEKHIQSGTPLGRK